MGVGQATCNEEENCLSLNLSFATLIANEYLQNMPLGSQQKNCNSGFPLLVSIDQFITKPQGFSCLRLSPLLWLQAHTASVHFLHVAEDGTQVHMLLRQAIYTPNYLSSTSVICFHHLWSLCWVLGLERLYISTSLSFYSWTYVSQILIQYDLITIFFFFSYMNWLYRCYRNVRRYKVFSMLGSFKWTQPQIHTCYNNGKVSFFS